MLVNIKNKGQEIHIVYNTVYNKHFLTCRCTSKELLLQRLKSNKMSRIT